MVNWFELMKRVQIKPAWSEIIQLLWCCMQWEYSNNPPTILLDSDNWKSILCISSKIMFTLFMFFPALLFRYLVEIIVNQLLFASHARNFCKVRKGLIVLNISRRGPVFTI